MTTCDLRPIKQKALSFPEPVRTLILSEPDHLDSRDLIVKIGQWDRLLAMAQAGGKT